MSLKWTDSLDIAIALDEAHPDDDPNYDQCHRRQYHKAVVLVSDRIKTGLLYRIS